MPSDKPGAGIHRDKIGHVITVDFVVPANDQADAERRLAWVLKGILAGSKIKHIMYRGGK